MEESNIAASGKCASCGIAEGDTVKLMTCTACKLVRYCSVVCQRDHRPQHKRACKKRMAELCEDLLFAQPESSHLEDCPICVLPMPFDQTRQLDLWCFGKIVCQGCFIADGVRQRHLRHPSGSFTQTCAFCRHPTRNSGRN